jgi:hypothetical protein
MAKKQTGWRGWWQSLWEESVATSTTVSETVSVAPSVAVSVAPVSETVSVAPTPTSTGDSVTLFNPSVLLVDQVATDTDLAGHEHVLWYSDATTLATMVGGAKNGAQDWWMNNESWPETYGHSDSTLTVDTNLFNIPVYRAHSCYPPDHYINTTQGIYATSGESAPWIAHRKYSRAGIPGNPNPSNYTPIGTEPITDAYFRWGIYLESSVFDGMNITGCKLATVGLESIQVGGTSMWFRTEQNGEGKWQVQCYWAGGDLAEWHGGHPDDYEQGSSGGLWQSAHGAPDGLTGFYGGTWYDGSAQKYLFPDQWHWFEVHYKLNSDASTSDGTREVWLDDELILQHPNCKIHTYTGSNTIEIQYFRNQVFHGGTSNVPNEIMWCRTAGHCVATRRIGKPRS